MSALEAERGNCAAVAYVLVAGDPNDGTPGVLPGAKIVHGEPLGRGGNAEGRRYFHAWVETVRDGRPVCVDYSNGLEVIMDRAAYYELGQITEVRRYNRHQAMALYRKHDHAGPWT